MRIQRRSLALVVSLAFLAAGCTKTEAPPKPSAATTAAVTEITRGTVSVDGIEIPYFIEGTGIPCLVTNNARAMSRALSQELRKTFRFIFMDMRANVPYNKEYDLEKVTLDTLLDDIELVRAAVGIDKLCVFGHSAGGLVAGTFRSDLQRHHERLRHRGTTGPIGSDLPVSRPA